MKQFIKNLLPQIIIEKYRQSNFPWQGDFSTWNEAQEKCCGYDADQIVKNVILSAKAVAIGESVYERDSVIFKKVEYSFPLSTALLYTAQRYKSLKVLDFGGGAGSSFYQNKKFLDVVPDVKWFIVEQKKLIQMIDFNTDKRLQFAFTIEEVEKLCDINFVLLSSVLQYLPEPYELIRRVLKLKPEVILIDRLCVANSKRDVITKQTVDDSKYYATYPCRFFSPSNILSLLLPEYELISEFDSFVNNSGILNNSFQVKEVGFFLKRK